MSDQPRSRRGHVRSRPEQLGGIMRELKTELAPATLLAAVQAQWPGVAGPQTAAQATPVGERDGVVTVACRSAVWAQELDMLGPQLVEALKSAVGDERLTGLRFTADAARHERP